MHITPKWQVRDSTASDGSNPGVIVTTTGDNKVVARSNTSKHNLRLPCKEREELFNQCALAGMTELEFQTFFGAV